MSTLDFNEELVIEGCKKNNRRSQELLYTHFAKKMYAICLGYAGNRPFAKDILQDSFIKVFKNIKDFKKDGSLEGWIRRIITNTAIDYLRKAKRENIFIEPENEIFYDENPNLALEKIAFNELMEQVDRLPQGARLVFNMHALDGYTHKEIAKELDITEGTSKSQFNRARKLLMNFIANINI